MLKAVWFRADAGPWMLGLRREREFDGGAQVKPGNLEGLSRFQSQVAVTAGVAVTVACLTAGDGEEPSLMVAAAQGTGRGADGEWP